MFNTSSVQVLRLRGGAPSKRGRQGDDEDEGDFSTLLFAPTARADDIQLFKAIIKCDLLRCCCFHINKMI